MKDKNGNIANALLAAHPYRKLDALDKKYTTRVFRIRRML
jgi:hypothetical protein